MKPIRKEILIAAPPARVWEHLTNSTKLAGWFLPNDFEPKPGKRFTLNCNVNGRIACVVKELVPGRKLVYSFKPESLPFETLVSVALEEAAGCTRLTLVHSGWEGLKPEQAGVFQNFDRGWQSRFLRQLKAALEHATTPS